MRRSLIFSALVFLSGAGLGVFALAPMVAEMRSDTSIGLGAPAGVANAEADAPDAVESTALTSADDAGTLDSDTEPDQVRASDSFEALSEHVGEIEGRWHLVQDAVTRLSRRVEALEEGLERDRLREEARVQEEEPQRRAPRDSIERIEALVAAGLEQEKAEEIEWRQGQISLDRLELRDLAMREGWFGSDRYRDELEVIDSQARPLRDEAGEASYDRYLFLTGQDNRVRIDSVIPGSVAEQTELQPGDVIETYAGTRVFNYADLRQATIEGQRDELVSVQIRRGDALIETWVARGPLGVRLDSEQVDPDR